MNFSEALILEKFCPECGYESLVDDTNILSNPTFYTVSAQIVTTRYRYCATEGCRTFIMAQSLD